MSLQDNLQNAWRFNEASGTTTADEGPANNTGTLHAGAALGGGVLTCDGSGGASGTPVTIAEVSLTGDWTIAWRGKTTGVDPNNAMMLGRTGSGSHFIYLRQALDFKLSGGEQVFTTVLPVRVDHHYLVNYDSVTHELSLYLDGIFTEVLTVSPPGTLTFDQIGNAGTGFGPIQFAGTLDYLYTWLRKLSGGEAVQVAGNPDNVVATDYMSILPLKVAKNFTNKALRITGVNTNFGGTTVFTFSGPAGSSLVSYNVINATTVDIVVTTGNTAGTITITETITGSHTANVSVVAMSFTINQATGLDVTPVTLVVVGTDTAWTQETAAGLFSVSGGAGASMGTPVFSTDTHGTVVLNTGTAGGALTVIDNSSGATAGPFTVYVVAKLHSRPGAPISIFLNFAGGIGNFSGTPHTVPPFGLVNDAAAVHEVWERCAEKYIIFEDVDVTTEYPGPPTAGSIAWAMLGGAYTDWYGTPSSGVSPKGQFLTNSIACTSFVFTNTMSNVLAWCGDCAAHEVGHLFGLEHQSDVSGGTVINEYSVGHDGWAPIMGNFLVANRSTWWNGISSVFGFVLGPQDDIAVIESGGGATLIADDVGNAIGSATPLTVISNNVSAAGLINDAADVDVWSFSTGAGSCTLTLTSPVPGPTLDAALDLLDFAGELIVSNAPSDSYVASITQELVAGNYYLRVRGGGDYGDVGRYVISGTVQPISAVTQHRKFGRRRY